MVFGRRREPLANATNYPVGNGPAINDPVVDNDPFLAGGKRRSGLFSGRRNRNSLTKPMPAVAPGNNVNTYTAGPGAGLNGTTAPSGGMPGNGMGTGPAMGVGAPMGAAGGMGAGRITDPQTGVTIPGSAGVNGPTSTSHGQPITPTASNARSLRKSGKMDSLMGTLFCNQRMKMEGEMKQEQAHAMAYQAAELNQADRLEKEARARRERAVAHGAHPAHGALGGVDRGVGATAGAGMTGGAGGANMGAGNAVDPNMGAGVTPGAPAAGVGRASTVTEPGLAGVGAHGPGMGYADQPVPAGAGIAGTNVGHGPMGTGAPYGANTAV